MYYQVHRLQLKGLSLSAIATVLALNRRTVVKYAAMNEAAYQAFLLNKDRCAKLLSDYDPFVKDRLTSHPAASAAQVHDWLKGHHKTFPKTSTRTVYNFVMAVRHKYGIALQQPSRQYFVVEELPYGLQVQTGFGQYIMHNKSARKCISSS